MKITYRIFGIAVVIAAITLGTMGMLVAMLTSAIFAVVLLLAASSDEITRIKTAATSIDADTRVVARSTRQLQLKLQLQSLHAQWAEAKQQP